MRCQLVECEDCLVLGIGRSCCCSNQSQFKSNWTTAAGNGDNTKSVVAVCRQLLLTALLMVWYRNVESDDAVPLGRLFLICSVYNACAMVVEAQSASAVPSWHC